MLCLTINVNTPIVQAQTQQASAPNLDWQKNYAGNSLTWVCQAKDGGYVFFYHGYTRGGYSFVDPARLTKIDSSGNIQWVQSFDMPFPEAFITTSDGGYACTILNESTFTICKMDSNGKNQWNQTYENLIGNGKLFLQTKDGGYAVAAQKHVDFIRFEDGDYVDYKVLVLLKTDAQGAIQWNKTINLPNYDDTLRSFIQTSDGGYALAGSSGTPIVGTTTSKPPLEKESDFYLVKINAEGNLEWTKTFGGASGDDANALVQTSDGGYALAGNTVSFGAGATDALIVKTDGAGNAQWVHTYGGYGSVAVLQGQTDFQGKHVEDAKINASGPSGAFDDFASSLIQTRDGGLAFAGSTQWGWPNSYGLMWLVKLDANGVMQWNQTYGNFETAYVYALKIRWDANDLIQADDGSFVIAGIAGSDNAYQQGSFLVKTKPAPELPAVTLEPGVTPVFEFSSITIEPDGSVTPSNAPVTREGNKYSLNGDIHNPLIVKTDNIVINGQGHLLNGNGTLNDIFVLKSQTGIEVSGANVTVQGLNVQNFKVAVHLKANNPTVTGNIFEGNDQAVLADSIVNPLITQNEVTGYYQGAAKFVSCLNGQFNSNILNGTGVTLEKSNRFIIANNYFGKSDLNIQNCTNTLTCGNTFDNAWSATVTSNSQFTIIAANNYTKCNIAVDIYSSSNNKIYLNNFVNNSYPPNAPPETDEDGTPLPVQKTNFWDDGTSGNYWSDYKQLYPNAKTVNGQWSTPYIIAENNVDHHPLVSPVTADKTRELVQSLTSSHTQSDTSSHTNEQGEGENSILNMNLAAISIAAIIIAALITGLIYHKRQKTKTNVTSNQ